MIGRSRPIRFLLLVTLGWTAGRSVLLWPDLQASDLMRSTMRFATALPALPQRSEPPAEPPNLPRSVRIALSSAAPPVLPAISEIVEENRPQIITLPTIVPPADTGHRIDPLSVAPSAKTKRLVVSTWAIVRDGSGETLAGSGQLGGSQAGVRASYGLTDDRSVAVAARLSGPLSGRSGREVALGIEWQPTRHLPARLIAERRFSLNEGRRDAFAFGLFGGVDGVALPAKFRLDGYGQAGMVGLSRQDSHVDGAVRVERPVGQLGPMSMTAGGGLWGAAQPGVSRLDVGPQIVLRVPTGITTLRVGLDWRQRIAGNARPGSGPALSVGADF